MENKSSKAKLNYLDIARGIGIVVVILAHVDTGDNPLCSFIGSFCMSIFFIVSGALLFYLDKWRKESLGALILKRIKGVLYPYFTFSFLVIAYYTFMRVVFKDGSFSNIYEIFKSTIRLEGYDAMWFMPTLFFAELVFLLWMRFVANPKDDNEITLKKSSILEWIGFLITLFLSLVLYIILHYGIIEEYADGWFLVVKITRVLMSAVFIYAGYFYFKYKNKLLSLNKKAVTVASVFIIVADMFVCQPNHFVDYAFVRIVSLPLLYACGILVPCAILYLLETYNVRSKVFEFFGCNSLTMMATHNPLPLLVTVRALYQDYVPSIARYVDDVIILIIILLLEIPIVLFINKFLPFLVRFPKKR